MAPATSCRPTKSFMPSLLILQVLCVTSVLIEADQLEFSRALKQTYNGPRLVISPNEPIFYVDTSYPSNRVLSCQTAGDKPELFNSVRWSGPNRMDNWDELRKRHQVTEEVPNSNVWDLEFRNPTSDDAGVYYCTGTFQISDQLNSSIVVKVVTPIKLESCPDRQFLVSGSTTSKITCRITADEPKVAIFKDNLPIDKYSNRYKWDNEDGLVINGEVNQSDSGRYLIKVRALSTGERREQYIDVQVHSKPDILPFNASDKGHYAVEGEPTKLECKVIGNPRPLVYWLDPRLRNLTSVGNYIVNPEQGTLIINKVNKFDDDGQFECFATNTVGTTSRKVTLTVDTRPQIVSFENKTVDEGSEVTFECRSSGEPKPEFSIRRQGMNQQPYRLGDGVSRDESTIAEGGGTNIYVHRLKITATKALFGIHYCNATNRAGTAERIGQLNVNFKPDLTQTPPEQFVKLGRQIAVTCHVRAFPQPKVTWLIDNTQVVNAETSFKTSIDGQTHIVTMMPPAQTVSSRYTCRADNIMGHDETNIVVRFTSTPSAVGVQLLDRFPTSAKVVFMVNNDGGDRIKFFRYRLEGRTLDLNNPVFDYKIDRQPLTTIDASPNPSMPYIIRNLLPFYAYKLTVRAVNDVGEGDETDYHFETSKPTKPEHPIIIKPLTYAQPTSGYPSEYQNGYVLKWSPPESDNGDEISRYIIRYRKIDSNSLDLTTDVGQERIIEQMNERPMHVRLGPLEINQRYRIQIQARNRYGDSVPDFITIHTTADRPPMPEFDATTLAWLIEPSTSTLVAILLSVVVLAVVIDLTFCFCFQIGLAHIFRKCCCRTKTNSVISDKAYP